MRLAAGVAIVAIVSYASLSVLGPRLGPGSQPTATPGPTAPVAVPTPSEGPGATRPPLDTSSWYLFASAHNWLGILVPRGWTDVAADHDWTLENDAAWPNTAADRFVSPDGQVTVSAWSVRVQAGTTLEEWLTDYCPRNTSPCAGLTGRAVPTTADPVQRHPGLLVPFDGNVQAFFRYADRIFAVAVWRGESDPSVAAYGGARRLLEAFAGSMCFDCASPVGATPLP
jgi:hypothetical protein